MPATSSWQALLQNRFSRNFGGTKEGVADPYVTGYFWAYWTDIPDALGPRLQKFGISTSQLGTILTASCEAVTTIPEFTLNKSDITALGGTKWSVPSNIDIGNSITTRHREFSGLPIYKIMRAWCTMIRDYRTGVSALQGDDYTISKYSCTIFYFTTKPDGKTVEFALCCTGAFPTRPNEGNFAHDVGTSDTVASEIEWNCNLAYIDDWVYEKCQQIADNIYKDTSLIYSRKEGV